MAKSRKRKPPGRAPSVQHLTGSPGPTVTDAGGRTWRLGFNTQNAKGRLEELVRAQVVRGALRVKREMPGGDGEAYFADAQDALAAGHYDTFGRGWFRVLKSAVGAHLFLLSLLQHHHPQATEDDARRLLAEEPEQTEAAIAVIAPDFFMATAKQMGASPAAVAAVVAELAKTTAPTPERATGSDS